MKIYIFASVFFCLLLFIYKCIYTDMKKALRWRRELNETTELITTPRQEDSDSHPVPSSQLQSYTRNTGRYVYVTTRRAN